MTNPLSKQFKFTQLVYFDAQDEKFTGVCLELNLVVESDSLESSISLLNDATVSHLLAAAEVGFPSELIVRPAPAHYWQMVKSVSAKVGRDRTLSAEEFALFTQNITLPELHHAAYPATFLQRRC